MNGIGYGTKAGYQDFAGGDRLIQLFESVSQLALLSGN